MQISEAKVHWRCAVSVLHWQWGEVYLLDVLQSREDIGATNLWTADACSVYLRSGGSRNPRIGR